MLEMWLLIVLVDNPSLAAIARLDSPDATSSSPSSTRSGAIRRQSLGAMGLAHSKELRSSGTSTACGRSTARSITSSARAFVEASTTGGATPAS